MFAKFAAARQLGVTKLLRRVIWRWKMFFRIVIFKLFYSKLRVPGANIDSAPQLTSEYSFLPSTDRIEALLAKNVLRNSEQDRIRRQTEFILEDAIEVRGIGQITLQWQPGNWYAQIGESGQISAAESVMVNRHDFLLPLVQSLLLTGSAELSAKVKSMFIYWIDNFSTQRLLRHDTPIDAAIRLINWLWVFHFDLLELAPRYRIRLLEIIRIQVEYISAWRRQQAARIPEGQRKLVTDHGLYSYFADEYGFEIIGTVIPSFTSTAGASAGDVARLVGVIEAEGVPAVFIGATANQGTRRLAEALAEEVGEQVRVLPLLSGSLAPQGEPGDTYIGYMRYNIDQIVLGLAGQP